MLMLIIIGNDASVSYVSISESSDASVVSYRQKKNSVQTKNSSSFKRLKKTINGYFFDYILLFKMYLKLCFNILF